MATNNRDNPQEDWSVFRRALARVAEGGHPQGPAPLEQEDEEMLACLGAAVIAHWGGLPRDVQRQLFETALDAAQTLTGEDLRLHLALVLHAHHARTADKT
jgi:hypothetical protein